MAISKIKLGTLFSISIIILNVAMAIETPKHTLVKKENGFEIRQYDSMIIATTKVRSDYSDAASTGFRRIASYIFGGNSANMSIKMTAPVLTNSPDHQDDYEIQFVMPSEFLMEDLPQPNSQNVTLKKVNLGRTAVLRFGGWATEERASKYKDKLRDLLAANGYTPNGTFMVAQYNSPWAIPPFRKNEIIVQIK
jgi:DNA gyrase inhibitor GyrI